MKTLAIILTLLLNSVYAADSSDTSPSVVPVMSMDKAPKFPYRAYLNNLEEKQMITAYSEPGLHWSTCEQEINPENGKPFCKKAVGWLDRNATVKVVGDPFVKRVINPYTGATEEVKYVEVEFFYLREYLDKHGIKQVNMVDKKGYIEYSQIFAKPANAFFATENQAQPVETPADKACPEGASEAKQISEQAKPMCELVTNLGVNQTADELKKFTGFCALKNPPKLPNTLPSGNTYDSMIYNRIKSVPLGKVRKAIGRPITTADLTNIDAVARTLYGEMGYCFKQGLHYPMAVARVIFNRAAAGDVSNPYVKEVHAKGKPTLAKVATSMGQFVMWKPVVGRGPLNQALCPPREKGKPFYRSKAAPQEEADIWTNAMRIATEMVLFPEKFKARAKNFNEVNYTTNLSPLRNTKALPEGASFINKMTQVFPIIDGRKVSLKECVEIWRK